MFVLGFGKSGDSVGAVMPGIIAFTFAQKLFFKGLMEGVVKG